MFGFLKKEKKRNLFFKGYRPHYYFNVNIQVDDEAKAIERIYKQIERDKRRRGYKG